MTDKRYAIRCNGVIDDTRCWVGEDDDISYTTIEYRRLFKTRREAEVNLLTTREEVIEV